MLTLNNSLLVQIQHFLGLLWPIGNTTQKGQGTNVGAGPPCLLFLTLNKG
jgi:hypothetical protein